MDEKVHDYIVNKLARDVNENDLILAVCEQQQVNWKEAEALIAGIKSEHADSITARQLPLKSIIAVATLAIGLALVIGTTIFMVDLVTVVSSIISAKPLTQGDVAMAQVLMNQSPAAIPLIAAGFINGLGMIFGSLLGMRETWAYLIDKISSLLWN